MRDKFNRQLIELNTELVEMGILCEEAIAGAARTLFDKNGNDSETVFETEDKIDQKERAIENKCMKLLLKQQPVAGDLRIISAALKMISDMERIGDQAADIAEITRDVRIITKKGLGLIKDMAAAASAMVTKSIDSFVRRDMDMAAEVIKADDEVDALFMAVRSELIMSLLSDPASGEYCLDLLMIAKYLERIGDHAVNIAEWVQFSITGKHVGKGK